MGFFADIKCKIHIDAYGPRPREVATRLTPTLEQGLIHGPAPSITEEAL